MTEGAPVEQTTGHAAALDVAHRELMIVRLPRFAVCWLGTTVLWCGVLTVQGRVRPTAAAATVAFQAGVLGAARLLCRGSRRARGERMLVTAAILLGFSSTALFAVARGSGDALAFALLTLYLASALFFAWGWRAELVVWIATVLGWCAAAPFLVFRLQTIELATAILIGSVLALAIAEGAGRTFRLAWLHRANEARTRCELERSRDAAHAATRAKDDFLGMLSHELRTPLNAMLAWAQLMRRGTIAADKIPHALEVIERNARLQARLIEDLLDVSRIAHGKVEIALAPVDVRQVAQAAVDTIRGVADAKHVRVELEYGTDMVSVRGDPARLQQVMQNLVSNGVKFTAAGGRVTVAVRSAGGRAEITVTDTGIGMRPETVARIFEPFHQEDSSIVRRHGGLGLGLAIARHLVGLHGGTIDAASAGEGKGSTFTVRLPLDHGVEWKRVPMDAPAASLPTLDGLRVMVVDDERDARDLFTTLLSASGATVTPVASVAEAMVHLASEQPDVLLADLAMPGEDGFTLIQRVRRMERERGTHHMRAIAVTALAGPEDRGRAMAAGFDLYLAKPVEPQAVVAAVAGAFTATPGG